MTVFWYLMTRKGKVSCNFSFSLKEENDKKNTRRKKAENGKDIILQSSFRKPILNFKKNFCPFNKLSNE